jgi:hypothetical protein
MTKTKIINDVPAAMLRIVVGGLQADGYQTQYYLEPDSEYTVIGTKQVSDAASAVSSDAQAKKKKLRKKKARK